MHTPTNERNLAQKMTSWFSAEVCKLRLYAPNEEGLSSIPSQESRSHILRKVDPTWSGN